MNILSSVKLLTNFEFRDAKIMVVTGTELYTVDFKKFVDEFLKCDLDQYFPVVLFILLYKCLLSFASVDEILKCEYSNKSY